LYLISQFPNRALVPIKEGIEEEEDGEKEALDE
jgi:hypothetical protein